MTIDEIKTRLRLAGLRIYESRRLVGITTPDGRYELIMSTEGTTLQHAWEMVLAGVRNWEGYENT